MHITFVIPHDSLAGGIRVVAIYTSRLRQRGHTVTVISAPLPPLSLKQRVKALFQATSQTVASPHPQSSYFNSLEVHHHTIDSYRPLRDDDVPHADVIIATWWETAEWIAPLADTKGTKIYFIQGHEVFAHLPLERVRATYQLPFFRITISQWLVDLLRDDYQSNSRLVPNGVDLKQFFSPVRSKAMIPTIGVVYSTLPCKGCDISLQAFILAKAQIPNLQLVAFGSEQPTAQLPLPDGTQYFLQPPQETLRDIYSQCDAWLFGSRAEGFGLPILEAMACRTPVIATPAGAAPELLAVGGGVLLSDLAPKRMAQAIQDMDALEPYQWQAISQQAYQTACQSSWEDATDRFEAELYRAIAIAKHNPLET